MNEKYKIGQFGRWKFTTVCKKGKETLVTSFDIEGAIVIESERTFIRLLGTDGQEYLVDKRNIKDFESMTVPKGVFEISVI